jgi:hypothetical protein
LNGGIEADKQLADFPTVFKRKHCCTVWWYSGIELYSVEADKKFLAEEEKCDFSAHMSLYWQTKKEAVGRQRQR